MNMGEEMGIELDDILGFNFSVRQSVYRRMWRHAFQAGAQSAGECCVQP